MSTLLAIVTSLSICAVMRTLLKEETANEIKYDAFVGRLELRDFNARMRAAGAPGYWPLSE